MENRGHPRNTVTAESGRRWLLRFIGITTIPAFVAAGMPQCWLA